MKIEKISYRRLFPTGAYANEAIELSGTLEPNEDILNAYTQLHKMAQELHYSKNAEMYAQMGTQVEEIEPIDKIKGWIQVIDMATNKVALERFKTRVGEINDEKLTEAYNNKLKSFQ